MRPMPGFTNFVRLVSPFVYKEKRKMFMWFRFGERFVGYTFGYTFYRKV